MFIFMKKFVILFLIIAIISSSFLFVSSASYPPFNAYSINLYDANGNNLINSFYINDWNKVQSVDIEFAFVYDENITFNESQYVNQINITVWRDIDGTLISERASLRPSNYVVDSVYGVDPCFCTSKGSIAYNHYLSYFGYEDDLFNSVPGYHFRDVLTAFVETQNNTGVNYYRDYSYSDFVENGYVYYSRKYWPEEFNTGNYLNFYQSSFKTFYYNLYGTNGVLNNAPYYFVPGFTSISFGTNKDLYNINYVRNSDLVFVRQINFSLVDNFNNPYVGVNYASGMSTYIPLADFVYNSYVPYQKLPDDVFDFFSGFFLDVAYEGSLAQDIFSLYLYTSTSGATPEVPPMTPEEQEKHEQDLKEKEDLQRALTETSWLDNTVQSTFRKETLYNNAINGLEALNKPNFNTNDFKIDDSSKADLYNFAGLYASVFNLDIVNSMLLFGFILAFVSYVLFGKKV